MDRYFEEEQYKLKNKRFNQRLTTQEIILGTLVLVPAFLKLMSYVSSAIVKFYYAYFRVGAPYSEAVAVLNFINDFLIVILGIICLGGFLKKQLKEGIHQLPHIFVHGVLLGMAFNYAASAVANLIVQLFATSSTTSTNQTIVQSILTKYPFWMLISIVILAPVAEEIVFRGVLFTWLRKYNRILAYLVSGLLFGFVHVAQAVFGGNPAELILMLPYAATGLVLCYVYESCDNLLGSIALHLTNNLLASLIILLI